MSLFHFSEHERSLTGRRVDVKQNPAAWQGSFLHSGKSSSRLYGWHGEFQLTEDPR